MNCYTENEKYFKFYFIRIKKKSNVADLINSYIFADLKNNNLNTLLCTQS